MKVFVSKGERQRERERINDVDKKINSGKGNTQELNSQQRDCVVTANEHFECIE